MKGNLELYVTHSKFKLDMATRNQKFSINGTWKAEKNRATLTMDGSHFENPTPEDEKALGLRIIKPAEIQAVFGHPFVLDESPDRRRLTGLKTSLGHMIGRFEFERPIPR